MKRKFSLHFQWLNSKKPHRVIEIQNGGGHNLLKTDHSQFKTLTRWKCERYTSEETWMNFLKLQAKLFVLRYPNNELSSFPAKIYFTTLYSTLYAGSKPVSWFIFLSWLLLAIWEEGASVATMPPKYWPMSKSVGNFYWLMSVVGGLNPSWAVPPLGRCSWGT